MKTLSFCSGSFFKSYTAIKLWSHCTMYINYWTNVPFFTRWKNYEICLTWCHETFSITLQINRSVQSAIKFNLTFSWKTGIIILSSRPTPWHTPTVSWTQSFTLDSMKTSSKVNNSEIHTYKIKTMLTLRRLYPKWLGYVYMKLFGQWRHYISPCRVWTL